MNEKTNLNLIPKKTYIKNNNIKFNDENGTYQRKQKKIHIMN